MPIIMIAYKLGVARYQQRELIQQNNYNNVVYRCIPDISELRKTRQDKPELLTLKQAPISKHQVQLN